jgi:cell division inhibitor SulA
MKKWTWSLCLSIVVAPLVGCATVSAPTHARLCAGVDNTPLITQLGDFEVRPLKKRVGKAMIRQAAGVDLIVPAHKGHTPAHLERVAVCQMAKSSAMTAGNPFSVPKSTVRVVREGPYHVVRLESSSRHHAQELIDAAQNAHAKRLAMAR